MHFGFIGPKRRQGVLGIVAIQLFHLVNCFEGIHSKWNTLHHDVWVLFWRVLSFLSFPWREWAVGHLLTERQFLLLSFLSLSSNKRTPFWAFHDFLCQGKWFKTTEYAEAQYLPNNRWLVSVEFRCTISFHCKKDSS